MLWLPMMTWPFSKRMRDFGTFQAFAANSTRRFLMVPAAALAAMPLRSEPEDAAVGEVLGTLSVVVAVMRTRSVVRPNSSATTWATFM